MRKKLLHIILFIACVQLAHAQEYNFIKYNVQEGLPQSQVYDIFQDSKSYLWLATQGGGVCRFDGKSFETFSTRDGLPSNFVHSVLEDKANQLWFGTRSGLASYDHKQVDWSDKSNRIIYSLAEINDSTLYLGTQAGILSFDKKTKKSSKLQLEAYLDISRINDIQQVGEEWWIASSRGLYIKTGELVQKMGLAQGLLSEDIKKIKIDKDKQVLVLQFGGGLTRIDAEEKTILQHITDPKIRNGHHIYVPDEKEIWISTQTKGIQIYHKQDSSWTSIGEAEGLSHSNVQEVFKDSWGNVWIATSGGGLLKFLGQFFKHYNDDNGLMGNRIYAIEESSQGDLWMSIGQQGVSVIDSNGIQNNIDSSYITTKCNDIFEDSEGRLWMCTSEDGLLMKDSTGFHLYGMQDGLPSEWIKTIVEDSLGYLWIGTLADGLSRIRMVDSINFEIDNFGISNGLPDLFILSLQLDPIGRVWFSTKKGGIGFAYNNKIKNLTPGAGLPKVAIRSIAFDSFKNVWLATAEEGIYYASYLDLEPKFKKLESEKPLSSDNIYLMSFDQEGNMWTGSEVGLDKIIFNEAGVVMDVQHFGLNEGFLGVETCHNAVEMDSKGHLWFGTLNGLTRHKPGSAQLSLSKPIIHFTSIDLMHEDIGFSEHEDYLIKGDSLKEEATFKHNKNDIGFNFKAINPNSADGIKYSWKLSGLDEDWSKPSRSESVNYTNLPPGTYSFKARALAANGMLSNTIATSFEIIPAFWQTNIFKLLLGLLSLLLLFGIFSLRVRRIKRKEKAKRAELVMKNELLSLEQKALQLQMNPHFIFNALNSIQSLVVNQKTDVAREQIQTFAGLMRGILTNSKQERITLKEEYETLDKYLKMEQFCQPSRFEYEIKLPAVHDADEIEIPPMLIQPFVENSIFHGVSHLKKGGRIEVLFSIKDEQLHCEIIDNGVGRKRAQEIKKENKKGHQSVALEVTQKRLGALNTNGSYEHFSIEDVLNKDGEVGGTKVSLVLPLEVNY